MPNIRNPHPKELDGVSTKFVGHTPRERGNAVQELFDSSGIETNYGKGNDLPELEEEIKTKQI